jgi:hypothetical protein
MGHGSSRSIRWASQRLVSQIFPLVWSLQRASPIFSMTVTIEVYEPGTTLMRSDVQILNIKIISRTGVLCFEWGDWECVVYFLKYF